MGRDDTEVSIGFQDMAFSILMEDYEDEDRVKQIECKQHRNAVSHFIDVPHVRQLNNWDCGLACIEMVLRTLGINHYDIHDLGELCSTRSIWTVDLAYLLHTFCVTFSFFTVTLGANPDFSVEAFYKEQLQDDLGRVDALFSKALEVGINIQCRSITGNEISSLILSGNYIAVALVDKYKLSDSWINDICTSECYEGNLDYIGHYIVICGYDVDTDQFEIRDPASSRIHERVSSKCLEEARKSFGTDEDILVEAMKMKTRLIYELKIKNYETIALVLYNLKCQIWHFSDGLGTEFSTDTPCGTGFHTISATKYWNQISLRVEAAEK